MEDNYHTKIMLDDLINKDIEFVNKPMNKVNFLLY